MLISLLLVEAGGLWLIACTKLHSRKFWLGRPLHKNSTRWSQALLAKMGFLWNPKTCLFVCLIRTISYLPETMRSLFKTNKPKTKTTTASGTLRALNKIKRLLLPPLGKKILNLVNALINQKRKLVLAKLEQKENRWKTFPLPLALANVKPSLLRYLRGSSLTSPPCLHPASCRHPSFPCPIFSISRWVEVIWCSGFTSRAIFLPTSKKIRPF